MAHSVFISYASPDSALAQTIVERFERADISCWIAPRDIQAGDDWSSAIPPAIDAAKVLVAPSVGQLGRVQSSCT
jgi:TIR domain